MAPTAVRTSSVRRREVRSPAPPSVAAPRPPMPVPPNESRRARRRRLGIPRRITVRVILFAVLIAAVPFGAYFAIHWYAYDNWYPTVRGSDIAVVQGRAGGVLWFKPKVVAKQVTVQHNGTNVPVTTSNIQASALSDIRSGVQEPSLSAAETYISNIASAYYYHQSATSPTSVTSTTVGVGPDGSIPNLSPQSTFRGQVTTTTIAAP
jgi:hypothetical protein